MDPYPGQVALILAPAAPAATAESLGFADRRRVSPLLLAPLLRRYGKTFSSEAHEVEAVLELTLVPEAVRVWLDAPQGGHPHFLRVWSAVSVAMQRALRAWLPYVWFSDLARFDDIDTACPMLVYAHSRVFMPSSRHILSADVLDDEVQAGVFGSARRNLHSRLPEIESMLAGAGRTDAAAFYHSRDRVLDLAHRRRRLVNGLLVAEGVLIEEFLLLGQPELAALRVAEAKLHRRRRRLFVAQFVHTTRARLRRLYGGQDFTKFGSMLLVEATAALAAALGRPVRPELRLVLS